MRRPALALSLLLAACGPADEASQLPLGIAIQGLTAQEIGHVQVVVLSRANSYSCPDLRVTCLRSRVLKADGSPIADLVKLKDAQGGEHNALLFDIDGTKVMTGGQTFEARMAPGSNYMVVAEVLSKDAVPKLVASGCSNVLAAVGAGTNAGVQVKATALAEPATCDAVID